MKTHLRVLAIVVFILAIGCGTASAYNKTNMQSVVIDIDGVPRMVSTEKETIGELLAELENTIDTNYFLENAQESDAIESMMTISLTSVTEKTVASTEPVPFKTVERKNNLMNYGEKRVVQEGKNGEKSVISKELYHGSELIDTKFVEEKILTPATDKIVEIGTKKEEVKKEEPKKAEPAKSSKSSKSSGNVINGREYSKVLKVKATAYTPYDGGCTGMTASGTRAGVGTIAVDPKVIPMGTKLYIPGYGVGTALDTGGAIKGNKIDVCYMTKGEAYNWGVKNLNIYILK